ncbi:hypothetical protein [Alkalihalobacillus sp. MEB130]|nr:hypothetical protein [Alkalihalobacillus sp. MEB130]
MPLSKRTKVEGLAKKRKDIILPGIQTILSLMKVVDASCIISSGNTI